MNLISKNRLILGIAAMLVIVSPMAVWAATGFLTIRDAAVVTSGDRVDRAAMTTRGNIPKDGSGGAFGYGIITSAGIIVTTTHKGVLDSELQSGPQDPVFHNHYVLLGPNPSKCGNNPSVIDITFDSPGQLAVGNTNVALKDLPKSSEGISQSNNVQNVVSFKLDPKFKNNNPNDELEAVCVTDITPAQNKVVK
jgi:hypothetical protein